MTQIGLNEYHETNIINYMRFSRTQRALSLRSIQASFKDIQNAKLKNETTFTVAEVQDLINDLWDYTNEVIDSELTHQAHTYILLLRQLFLQAEHWHLKMQADISELENKELLDRIKNFENEQFLNAKKANTQTTPRLEPVNDTGGTVLLREQISRLSNENQQLKNQIQALEQEFHNLTTQNSQLRRNYEAAIKSSNKPGNNNIEELEIKLANMKNEIGWNKDSNLANEKALENEMIDAKHRYLKVLEELKMAENELEKKFNQTNAYKNMKQILEKKNEQLKELKKRLQKYEPDA